MESQADEQRMSPIPGDPADEEVTFNAGEFLKDLPLQFPGTDESFTHE